jgi:RNA polymerase sigma-70 factor, ECF subfamily
MVVEKPASTGISEEAKERLLVEAAQQDPTRFGELYEANFERVYAFIAHRVLVREEAEDVTSEVFRKALANITRFKWRGVPFAAWLLRIAANLIADRHKRVARELASAGVDNLSELADANDFATQSSLEEVEKRASLFRLVHQLPVDQRRVIVMRFADEKSISEIAGALGRSEGAVKQLQFRGLQNLRASIGGSNG